MTLAAVHILSPGKSCRWCILILCIWIPIIKVKIYFWPESEIIVWINLANLSQMLVFSLPTYHIFSLLKEISQSIKGSPLHTSSEESFAPINKEKGGTQKETTKIRAIIK